MDSVRTFLKSGALVLFIGASVLCLIGAAVFGREGPDTATNAFVARFRKRARYLRWLSMACLGVMGAMIAAGVEAVQVSQQPDGHADHGEKVVSIAIAGLVAVVLASVYRYIIRLAYFYDSRADVIAFLDKGLVSEGGKVEPAALRDFAQVSRFMSPQEIGYSPLLPPLKALVDHGKE